MPEETDSNDDQKKESNLKEDNQSLQTERFNLTTNSDDFSSKEVVCIPEEEKRKTLNTYTSSSLALILWGILGLTVFWHVILVSIISYQFWTNRGEISDVEIKMDKSSSLISDTAKTLYAIITPLAATVTGFYFTSKSPSEDDSSE